MVQAELQVSLVQCHLLPIQIKLAGTDFSSPVLPTQAFLLAMCPTVSKRSVSGFLGAPCKQGYPRRGWHKKARLWKQDKSGFGSSLEQAVWAWTLWIHFFCERWKWRIWSLSLILGHLVQNYASCLWPVLVMISQFPCHVHCVYRVELK